MGLLNRRKFLRNAGLAGALGGASLLGRDALAQQTHVHHAGSHGVGGHGLGTVGRVDHERNGFDPTKMLRDFDRGKTRQFMDTLGALQVSEVELKK